MIDLPDGTLPPSGVVCVIDVGVARSLVTAALACVTMLELAAPVDVALEFVEAPELVLVELEPLEQAARATRIAAAVENTAARLLKLG
jgi:hypothetical protein